MKFFCFLLLPLAVCDFAPAQAQQPSVNTEEVLRRVADKILYTTTFQFVNTRSGEKYESVKGLQPTLAVQAESPYNRWGYPNGVMMTGLMHMSDILQEQKYADYCRHNYRFIFDNLPYFESLYKDSVVTSKDVRGLGVFLLAGTEMLRYEKNNPGRK